MTICSISLSWFAAAQVALSCSQAPNRNRFYAQVAFSEYPRCAPPETPWDDRSSCVGTPREKFTVMGLSVRVPEWRYTAWMYCEPQNDGFGSVFLGFWLL